MEVTSQILQTQLDKGVFENSNNGAASGVAKAAIANGYDSLSEKQKYVLRPYLKARCSGVVDPGGNHNECQATLEGEALLEAYRVCDDTESLNCENCRSEVDYLNHHRENFFRED